MSLEFRRVTLSPLRDFEATAPAGATIGIIGEDGAGKHSLVRLAAALEQPVSGQVVAGQTRRLLGPDDPLSFAPVEILLLHHTLARHDALVRARAAVSLERLRSAGTTTLLVTHEEDLLLKLSDEIWWLHEGRLAGRGDPRETLDAYRRHIAERTRAWGQGIFPALSTTSRRGDGRAEIIAIELLGEAGQSTAVWRSGELAALRVTVRFREPIPDPVIGIMIRSRIGLNVYGTNTELERLKLGPCAAGESLRMTFAFRCELCPGEYTLTVASHDPDGVRHDWLDDAVRFTVTDSRYTAGVANLRAQVTAERL